MDDDHDECGEQCRSHEIPEISAKYAGLLCHKCENNYVNERKTKKVKQKLNDHYLTNSRAKIIFYEDKKLVDRGLFYSRKGQQRLSYLRFQRRKFAMLRNKVLHFWCAGTGF